MNKSRISPVFQLSGVLQHLDLSTDNLSQLLTYWGRVTHICVLAIIGSDNGLSPGRHQAIIRTNAGILLTGPLATNFSEIFIEIYIFSFKKMHLKKSSGNCRPFCLQWPMYGALRRMWCNWGLQSPVCRYDGMACGDDGKHKVKWIYNGTGCSGDYQELCKGKINDGSKAVWYLLEVWMGYFSLLLM